MKNCWLIYYIFVNHDYQYLYLRQSFCWALLTTWHLDPSSGVLPAQPAAHCLLLLLQAEQLSDRPGQPQPLPTLPPAEMLSTGHEQRWWDTQMDKLSSSLTAFFLFQCVHVFVLLSCEIRADVQTSAGLSDSWSGAAPAAAAAAAAPGRRPVSLVLRPHQGPSRPLSAAPSAHGLRLLLQRRFWAAVLHRWCPPLPDVLPQRVPGVWYDLPRLCCVHHLEIPGEGRQQRTPWDKRWDTCVYQCLCVPIPSSSCAYSSFVFSFLMSGFDSRQPPHDLVASHPYSPLEDPYSLYPHSLRNVGEQTAQWANVCWLYWFFIFIRSFFLWFSDELCASIVRSHRETTQYRVEELQALRWKVLSREEIQVYQSKVNQPDDCFTILSSYSRISEQNMPFKKAWG